MGTLSMGATQTCTKYDCSMQGSTRAARLLDLCLRPLNTNLLAALRRGL